MKNSKNLINNKLNYCTRIYKVTLSPQGKQIRINCFHYVYIFFLFIESAGENIRV